MSIPVLFNEWWTGGLLDPPNGGASPPPDLRKREIATLRAVIARGRSRSWPQARWPCEACLGGQRADELGQATGTRGSAASAERRHSRWLGRAADQRGGQVVVAWRGAARAEVGGQSSTSAAVGRPVVGRRRGRGDVGGGGAQGVSSCRVAPGVPDGAHPARRTGDAEPATEVDASPIPRCWRRATRHRVPLPGAPVKRQVRQPSGHRLLAERCRSPASALSSRPARRGPGLELRQPALHREPPPPVVKDVGVAHDRRAGAGPAGPRVGWCWWYAAAPPTQSSVTVAAASR